MKKSFVLGILGLATTAASAFGQGFIQLDNYLSDGTLLTYGLPSFGNGVPANGVSGALGTPGTGLSSAWTVGLYWAPGTTGLSQVASYWGDMPDASLTLGAGAGSTVSVAGPGVFGQAGYYFSPAAFNTGSTLNTTITLEIVVWGSADASYAAARYRAHSAAFSMPTGTATASSLPDTGSFMPGSLFVEALPEPNTPALAGLGGLALWLIRRKKT